MLIPMLIKRILACTLFCAFAFPPGPSFGRGAGNSSPSMRSSDSKYTEAEREVLKLSEQCIAGEVAGDLAVMDRCFADDYTHIHAIGLVQTKAVFLDSFRTGVHRYEGIDLSDVRIRLYGSSTAIIEGHAHIRSVNSGHVTDANNLFANVWIKEHGKWREAMWVTVRPAPRSH